MTERKSQMHLIAPSLDSNRSVNSGTSDSLSRGTRPRSEFRILQLSTGARACLRKTVKQLVRINGLNAPFWNILRVYTVYTPVFLCNIRAKTEQMRNKWSIVSPSGVLPSMVDSQGFGVRDMHFRQVQQWGSDPQFGTCLELWSGWYLPWFSTAHTFVVMQVLAIAKFGRPKTNSKKLDQNYPVLDWFTSDVRLANSALVRWGKFKT